jgi:hypothetical protein
MDSQGFRHFNIVDAEVFELRCLARAVVWGKNLYRVIYPCQQVLYALCSTEL